VSFVFEQTAMSPTPTKTGSALAVVVKVHVGPVVVTVASLAVTNHSYFWPESRPVQGVVVVAPEATLVFWAICAKLPLANRRPMKVTVIGSLSGSVTLTLNVGEVVWPVAPLVGAFRVGVPGLAAAATGGQISVTNVDMSAKIASKPMSRLHDPAADDALKRSRSDGDENIDETPSRAGTAGNPRSTGHRTGDRPGGHQ
jgi:hypothetical protein